MYILLNDDEAALLKRMLATPANYEKIPGPDPAVARGVGIINKIQHEIDKPERERWYIDAAESHRLVSDGQLEIDGAALVSEGDDDGAYVMAWLWVEGGEISEEEE